MSLVGRSVCLSATLVQKFQFVFNQQTHKHVSRESELICEMRHGLTEAPQQLYLKYILIHTIHILIV